MHNTMDVLVTGCDQLTPLSVVRSLGRAGLKVLAAGAHPKSICFYSKHASGKWVYPSHFEDKKGFIESILEAIGRYKVGLVFPASESTLVVLDEFRDMIQKHAKLAIPPSEAIEYAIDKVRTYELAREMSIPVPSTFAIDGAGIASAVETAKKIGYPVILKRRGNHLYKKISTNLDLKVAYIPSENALLSALTGYGHGNDFPIMQKYVGGVGICISAVMDNGTPLCLFQYKRTRESPVTGGVSSLRESMPLDPRLRDHTVNLLRAMRYRGVAMVEFKYDEIRDTFTLMEVNPRVQTSTALALHAGVDIPYIVYNLFAFDKKMTVDSYQVGVKCQRLRLDLEAVEHFLRGRTQKEFLNGELKRLPSKGKLLLDFLKDSGPWVKGDVSSFSDPSPGWVEFGSLLSLYGSRLAGRIGLRRLQ
jgi:predicted ATP-grasp superfamily ATP-dependent carboligase